jgi:hypothetical protein
MEGSGVNDKWVQTTLVLLVGAVAAAFSWSHVLELAGHHGARGWMAWAVALCIETGAISGGLEVRRRRVTGEAIRFSMGVVIASALLQVSAQVAESELSVWGVIIGVVPTLTFLVLVKQLLARKPAPAATVVKPVRQPREKLATAVPSARPEAGVEQSAPTEAPMQEPAAKRSATDEDLERVVRPLVLGDSGRPSIKKALEAEGLSCGNERLGRFIAGVRSEADVIPLRAARS